MAPYTTETGKLSLIRNAPALSTNLTTEITHLLSGISIPTLVLWGMEDRFQPIHYGERLAKDIHESRLIRVKDASHFLMWDQPEIVTKHLLDFLDRTVPSRPLMV